MRESIVSDLALELGVKTDPIQYRYSYPWLFRLLAEEAVRYVQLGTFFEFYQLPDGYFHQLRRQAEDCGVSIRSVFTAHRELGGFFADEPGWERVARRNYERLIEVGQLLGAHSVGSNPGSIYRDRMETKPRAVERYLGHMKELMAYAHDHGVGWLSIEPMSCLAEPPTLPEEIRQMGAELAAWHRRYPHTTARVGFCADIAHGYADRDGRVRCDHLQLLASTLPYLLELHLKNTDAGYCSTLAFGREQRGQGVIEIRPVRELLLSSAAQIPVSMLVGYLEIDGPKLGRDSSDPRLGDHLRSSVRYLKQVWAMDAAETCPRENWRELPGT
jgi:ribulose-phosphate 3-epimerase